MASDSGYDAQFLDLPDHLTCPICCTGLRVPQLTHCGHRFCETCLEVVRRKDRSLACPVCREELASNQVYPDNAFKRDVLNLQVKCDQLEAGCTWIGELRQLQNHNSTCDFVLLQCPLGCEKNIVRRKINDHVKKHCSRRIIRCEYCLLRFEQCQIKKHFAECQNLPVNCPQDCGQVLVRRALAVHVSPSGVCPNTILKCEFSNSGCGFVGTRKKRSNHMEKEVVSHLSMSHLRMQEQLSDLKEQTRSVEFTYCWQVKEWSKKVEACKSNEKKAFLSEPFYISQPGYRMKLKLRPVSGSTPECAGVFLIRTEGDYDDVIGPFRNTYSLSFIDQRKGGQDKTHTITKKDLETKFPLSFTGKDGLGKLKLIRHDELSRDSFIVDDCLLIKLVVYRW
ncbi:TNF receptor-associated factor 6-like [Oscarella lobularis]|uniref:TNF receptor-associated factor 6-like n=1 Tax=Oscarella lobularis TaxID=121494 RepID=UPI0033132EEF